MSEATFDRIAGDYDSSLPAHVVEHYLAKRTELIVAECPSATWGRALDVGCGTGALAARLAARGYAVTGVDPSAGMLDVMRTERPEVAAVRGSGEALPFDDGSFDLALTVAALHHIAAPAAVRSTLAEMVRVVRPGGRIVVWDHNPRNPYWRQLMARVPQDDGSERLIGAAEIAAGLAAAGARPLRSVELGFVPDFIPPALLGAGRRVERLAERTPLLRRLGAHNVVVAARG